MCFSQCMYKVLYYLYLMEETMVMKIIYFYFYIGELQNRYV